MIAGGIHERYFDETERREGLEAFFHGESKVLQQESDIG